MIGDNCWQNIEQLLKCPSCGEIFRDPKLLFCGHRLCKNCIENDAISDSAVVDCSICVKEVNYIACKYTELLCKVMFQRKSKGDTVKTPSNVDAFELLLPSQDRRKWKVDKTYLRKNKLRDKEHKRIPFQNADTKESILQWLANTQNQFERLTQSQSQENDDFCEDNNVSFGLPSVSQSNIINKAKYTIKPKHIRLRSDEVINLRSRKVKRPHSLDLKTLKTPIKKNLNPLNSRPNLSFSSVSCNYNIEEYDTGPKLGVEMENPSVQKNIIQQLEDDFLNSIETEVDVTKYNLKNNCESTVASSGWDRMKQMKKSVCKGNKKAKKLKTLVQINSAIKSRTETENTINLRTRILNDNVATKDATTDSNAMNLGIATDDANKPPKKRGRPKKVNIIKWGQTTKVNMIKPKEIPKVIPKFRNRKCENLNSQLKITPVVVVLEKMPIMDNLVPSNVINSQGSCKNNNNEGFDNKIQTEIIDLTRDSLQENENGSSDEEIREYCEIIIKDISQSNNDDAISLEQRTEGKSKSVNCNFKTTKNKLSLKRNENNKNGDDGIFLLDTPRITSISEINQENEKNEIQILEENVDGDGFALPLINDIIESVYLDERNLNVQINHNIYDDIFLQETQVTNDGNTRNIISRSEVTECDIPEDIPLEIVRLQKLIETSLKIEDSQKNILKYKLENILQLFENLKVFESVETQTEQVALQDTSIQTDIPMNNIEVQTDSVQSVSICTQTLKVLIAEKCLQTTQVKEQIEFGMQVTETDLNPVKEINECLVENYLGSRVVLNNAGNEINGNSQSTIGKMVGIVEAAQEDLGSSVENLENRSEITKRTEENDKEAIQNKSSDNSISATQYIKGNKTILTENIIDTSVKDPLNVAMLLTESETTFSKPNSPAIKTQFSPKTQAESVGIISQTQPNRGFKKIGSKPRSKLSTPTESVGIISQTQLNRSPLKLFKAKLEKSKKDFSSPSKKEKRIDEIELSDEFDNLEYNTAEILAGGEVSLQNKLPPVKSPTQVSNIEISVDSGKTEKEHRKVAFDKSKVKRMKRIRFPDDTDSDEEHVKPKKRAKNKFVRDDLSIEFHTEAASNENSDDMLPEELPDVFDSDLADDFNFEDCIRNIENNFDPNYKKCESPTKAIDIRKTSTSKYSSNIKVRDKISKNTPENKNIHNTKLDDNVIFKSPVKRAKRSILSEIICPVNTERSPSKINILNLVVIPNTAQNNSFESDHDIDDIICSDDSFEENTKLRTVELDDVWTTPKRSKGNEFREISPLNNYQLPSLGDTPDMLNLPTQGEDIFLEPPPEFANAEFNLPFEQSKVDDTINHEKVNNLTISDQDSKNATINTVQDHNPIDTSTQRQKTEEKDSYDILSLSPIKCIEKVTTEASNSVCPLTVTKRDKPRAKPLNISNHSTPKVKQNSIYNYIKRTQNRIHLNNSCSSLLEETETLIKEQNNSPKRTASINSQKSIEKSVPCIVCSRLNKDDVIAVTSLVRKKLITFKHCFESCVTHLIVSVNKNNFVRDHTMKYISAVSTGIWILNSDWIKECIRCNEIVKEDAFEVLDVSGCPGPKESRLFRKVRPLLTRFRILASPPFRTSERNVIEDVVRNLGGSIVQDAIEFLDKGTSIDLVITEASSTQSFLLDDDWLNVYKVATVDIEWLSRSVGQYKTLSFLPFLLCDADEVQDLNVYPQELLVDIPGFTFSTQPENE